MQEKINGTRGIADKTHMARTILPSEGGGGQGFPIFSIVKATTRRSSSISPTRTFLPWYIVSLSSFSPSSFFLPTFTFFKMVRMLQWKLEHMWWGLETGYKATWVAPIRSTRMRNMCGEAKRSSRKRRTVSEERGKRETTFTSSGVSNFWRCPVSRFDARNFGSSLRLSSLY